MSATRVVTWSREVTPLGRAVPCIGVFDGVHIGHQALVSDTVALAKDRDALSVVATFDRDPDQVVCPDEAAPQLLDLADKLEFLAALRPDVILVVPFDAEVAAMEPDAFLTRVILGALSPVEVVVGYDFRFGRGARGDVDTLTHFGRSAGFGVLAHELVTAGGEVVTSTRIRRLLAEGDVRAAARLLGRPHRVRGRVAHGRGAGAALGVPTANVRPGPYAALPSDGVYSGSALLGSSRYAAGISVGVPPTFPEATDRLEAHLIAFEGDLYGAEIVLEFEDRIRDQLAFATDAELAEAIARDLTTIARKA